MRAQFTLFCLLIASSAAYALPQFNLTQGVTPVSHDIYDLHMTVFWICVAIGTIVFGIMIYSMINHRKSKGVKPANFHEHLWIEIIWTIIPFFILVSIAIPGTRVLMNIRDESKPDLTIKITGFQWKWKYDYIDQGVSFFSNISTPMDERLGKTRKNPNYLREVDHPVVVPIHKKIRFLVTSNDVIHAWWVPDLGVKQDAVPGFINENWTFIDRPGTYRGQCAELCGVNHAFMPIVVIAMTEKGFDAWVAQQKGGAAPASASIVPAVATSGGGASVAPAAAPIAATTPAATATTTPAAATTTAATATSAAPAATPAPAASAPTTTPVAATTTSAPATSSAPAATPATAAPATPAATAPTAAAPAAAATTAAGAPAPTAEKKYTLQELIDRGKPIFLNTCAACHQPNGQGMPPTFPNLITSPIVNGPVDKHIHTVVFGVTGTAMQAFGQQFSPEDIAAVITYERNEIGSKKGDIVQPADIAAAEKAGEGP